MEERDTLLQFGVRQLSVDIHLDGETRCPRIRVIGITLAARIGFRDFQPICRVLNINRRASERPQGTSAALAFILQERE